MDDDAFGQWLTLREPTDAVSRSLALSHSIANAVGSHSPVRAVDLATGTGSNIRYLIPHLGPRQDWLAVDRNPALLERLSSRMSQLRIASGCHIETRQLDLGILNDASLFADRHLVTASALLDLVSEAWLRSLAAHCRAVGAAALFTLSYNGRSSCTPSEPEDGLVLDLFNRHQRAARGLGGPAAGPDAAAVAVRCFANAGYHVETAPSDWDLGPEESALQRPLVDGWAEAATEIAPEQATTIASWQRRRLAHVDAGRARLVVGHDDVGAWLTSQLP